MNGRLAWIALLAAIALAFSWLLYAEVRGFVLARSTPNGLQLVAHNGDLLRIVLPLLIAGFIASLLPAWVFIVWLYHSFQNDDLTAAQQQLERARQDAQQAALHARQQAELAYSARYQALLHREAQAIRAQQQAELAQQQAAQQIQAALARVQSAEQRAQRATHAFRRVKRGVGTKIGKG
jgi:hypothetical protein